MATIATDAVETGQVESERRRCARMATVNRIGRLLTSTLDLDELMQRAIGALAEHLAFDTIALMLLDPQEPETLVLRACGGVYANSRLDAYQQSIHEGIAGAAARERRPVLVNDVRSDGRYIPVLAGGHLRAELAIPLVIGDRMLGVLNIESERPFAAEDAADLETVADQLAVAIDNARRFAASQAQLEETRLLYETSRRIGAATTIDEVVRAYLEQVAARGRYACAVALYDADERGELVRVRGRWQPGTGITLSPEVFPRTRDGLNPPLDAGQTVIVCDIRADERVSDVLREKQLRSGRPSLAMIPLMVRAERIGLVILSRARLGDWSEADLHPYQLTAGHLAGAIDGRLQQEKVLERGQRLAVLEERARLARDLHDSVTQLVFSSALVAQTLAAAWRRDPDEGERRVERLVRSSQLALVELRALLAELRPPPSDDRPPHDRENPPGCGRLGRDGLAAAIREHCAVVAPDALVVRVEDSGYVGQANAVEETLFRIAQEAIGNAVRHAHAESVAVRLLVSNGWACLSVIDDGIGFQAPSFAELPQTGGSGIGLRSMSERAAALGGDLCVTSAAGAGTTVTTCLPRKDRETCPLPSAS